MNSLLLLLLDFPVRRSNVNARSGFFSSFIVHHSSFRIHHFFLLLSAEMQR